MAPILRGDCAIPANHERCAVEPCKLCEANRYLTAEDQEIWRFYGRVSDQVSPLTPFGGKPEDGGLNLVPRLEGWEMVLRVYRYPRAAWPWLLEMARELHEAVMGRRKVKGLGKMKPEDLADPEE